MPTPSIEFDAITESAVEFDRQLDKLTRHMEKDIVRLYEKATFDLYSRIAERTPVDTGRAKANWSISLDPDDAEVFAEVSRRVTTFKMEIDSGDIYIYNNLDYIEALEGGHSGQAPQGMVAVSLADFAQHFREAAQRFNIFV